jgi:alkylation response protein AidB-like acyl-CoA dehydrogenase
MKSTARRDGDHYVLNGSKTFITNAPYADVFLIYAASRAAISTAPSSRSSSSARLPRASAPGRR